MEQIIATLVSEFERGRISRRELIHRLAVAVAAVSGASAGVSAASGFKAVSINHIPYQVADYGRTRDFYADLLGMKVANDDGKQQANLLFGTDGGYLLPRNARQPGTAPRVDHIAYTIENWNKDAVREELERRGLNPRPDTDLSFHVKDPDGYDVQIAGRG